MTDTPVNTSDATPKKILVAWANDQDAWLRHLVGEVMLSRKAPDADLMDRVESVFLAEKRFSDDSSPVVPRLENDETEEAADEALELRRIDNIKGVNALADSCSVEFDSHLTIFHGQNGTGKTGYARIIKRLAAVRTAERILPNANVSEPQPDPSADVTYALGGAELQSRWTNQAGLAPFTRISVFDSGAVDLHVNNELNYVFTPAELALFGFVSTGISELQSRLNNLAASVKPANNNLLSSFARNTSVYPVIQTLGVTTEIAELESLAVISDDAEEQREQLQQEVGALRSGTVEALIEAANQKTKNLQGLEKLLKEAQGFNPASYNAALEGLAHAEQERRKAREELFTVEELPGPPDDEWQSFISAGDNYRAHLGLQDYPEHSNKCLYCQQTLDQNALQLVQKYRTFLDESLARTESEARRQLESQRCKVSVVSLEQAVTFIEVNTASDSSPSWNDEAKGVVTDLVDAAQRTSPNSNRQCESIDLPTRCIKLVETLAPDVADALKHSLSLQSDKENKGKVLAEKAQALAELTAKIELNKRLNEAKQYVQSSKRAANLVTHSKQLANTLRSLTSQSKLASEDLVNKSFESLFREESAALRAPDVSLEFQGNRGNPERRKSVFQHKPADILSEGEQKVLAIADFLAESRMRDVKAPIVFDDPVTSLDYRRIEEVTQRILKLAETHQVVVFTHNIMFASKLIAGRQKRSLRCKFYEVRENGAVRGVLAPDVEPRLDTPKVIAGRVTNTVAAAKRATDAITQDALISQSYDLMRAWCEAFVEQELLSNVTQRYRDNVMMGGLSSIDVAKFPDASSKISALFEKICRYIGGHSQATEQLNTKPTVADLERDWEEAQKIRSEYL